jgi:hypothetical protein|tara:strand:- start:1469 stop:1624 length:156 start_codon:yes stop_codon:yes gene_type:complete
MVLINAIAAGTLFPLEKQPELQRLIVYGILVFMFLVVFMVWWLLWYILVKR